MRRTIAEKIRQEFDAMDVSILAMKKVRIMAKWAESRRHGGVTLWRLTWNMRPALTAILFAATTPP
jgi:hypothetical protein